MSKHRTRRHRRSFKAVLKHGEAAKRQHHETGGRSGMVQAKRNPSSHVFYHTARENPPPNREHDI